MFKNCKIKNSRIRSDQRGMTYVELIVVLSIFAVMSSVVVFNYGDFQAKVDVKNLSSDVALRIIGAQKAALAGLIPTLGAPSDWRPSYGIHFRMTNPKSFIYFADLNNDKNWEGGECSGECQSVTTITKDNSISGLNVYYAGNPLPQALSNLTVTFARPDSGATFRSATSFTGSIAYVEIRVVSPKGPAGSIKVYPSGRIEVN